MSTKVSAKPVPAAILLRVSTDKQETARQETELRAVAKAKGWAGVEVCEETITGRADIEARAGLQRVQALAAGGEIRKVLVHEISRLSRRPSVAHAFTEMLEGHGVSLYWHAQGIETLLPSGKRNPSTAIMLAVLAEMARAETDPCASGSIAGWQRHGAKA
ncbi:MAG TPA: recombinase family protein [Verrucomicrobiales bacterium]|nr:recombinase family protein [Verrucomicrobiales bacterium]